MDLAPAGALVHRLERRIRAGIGQEMGTVQAQSDLAGGRARARLGRAVHIALLTTIAVLDRIADLPFLCGGQAQSGHKGATGVHGTVESIWDTRILTGQHCGLSVPSSSGRSLQPCCCVCHCCSSNLSVPSSSGRSLQPKSFWPTAAGWHLSVPSSSGRSLQPLIFCPVFNDIRGHAARISRKPPICSKWPEVCESLASESVALICATAHHRRNPLLFQKISPQ